MIALSESRREGGGFWTGFALGGALFGAAGFFFAPQVRSARSCRVRRRRLWAWMWQLALNSRRPTLRITARHRVPVLHSVRA